MGMSNYKKYLQANNQMTLSVKKISMELYEAMATPPHVNSAWSTSEPISAKQLIDELKARGCHQQDIGDALYEQDSNWIENP
jgi:hypothetical protein